MVNPDSGPGTAIDPNYVSAIAALKAAGIEVFGYIHTSYGAVSVSSLEAQMQQWVEWYAPSGMFFDEMANTPGFEAYYSGLTAYAKSLGLETTIGNPGDDTLPAYVGTVDTIVIYEDAGFAHRYVPRRLATSSYPKSNFAFIAYVVASLNTATEHSLTAYIGSLYISSKGGSDPLQCVAVVFDGGGRRARLTVFLPLSAKAFLPRGDKLPRVAWQNERITYSKEYVTLHGDFYRLTIWKKIIFETNLEGA